MAKALGSVLTCSRLPLNKTNRQPGEKPGFFNLGGFMEYVIARTYSAGVFAGFLESRDGKEVTLKNARRLWYWDGAASLSQLAQEGVSKPENCKFPVEVNQVILTEVIEILSVTEEAKANIVAVPVWKK